MKTEKIIISFVAVLIGILASGIAFYLYQTTKVIQESTIKPVAQINSKPGPKITQKPQLFLTVDTPKDEDVVESRIISVTGKTSPASTVLISTVSNDQVVNPAKNGDFSATITLDAGTNYLEVSSISPTGDEEKIIKTVTVSSETF